MHEHRPSEVIYQIYPASFYDSDGDGHGDLKGITEKLDYLEWLGVDSIWMSPFFLSPPGPDGDGGYAVTDYRKIDPKYGTMDDFKELLDKAHEKGLRVYMDFIPSHTADDHDWFQKSRTCDPEYNDFYTWHDGITDDDGNRHPPNNWKSVFGGDAWTFDDQRQQYYLHHFLPSQPALNHNLKKVREHVFQEMKFWLDMDVDGFRIDAVPFMTSDPLLRDNPWLAGRPQQGWGNQEFVNSICQPETIEAIADFRTMIEQDYPNRNITLLGEAIAGKNGGADAVPVAASYVDKDRGLDMCYNNALMNIGKWPEARWITDTINYLESHFNTGGNCNSASNHDIARAASRMTTGLRKEHLLTGQKQNMLMQLCMNGSLCIYQGEELALPQARIPEDIPRDKLQDPIAHRNGAAWDGRDGARTPMPWDSTKKNAGFSTSDDPYLPVPESHYDLAFDRQMTDPNSMLHHTRNAIHWRKHQPALVKGTAEAREKNGLAKIFRRAVKQKLLCLFNYGSYKQSFRPSDELSPQEIREFKLRPDEEIIVEPGQPKFYGGMPYVLK